MLPLRVRQKGSGQAGSRWAAGPILIEGEWRMQEVLMKHLCFRFMTKVGKGVCWGRVARGSPSSATGWVLVPCSKMGKNGRRRESGGKKRNLPVCLTVLLTPTL